MGDLRRCAFDAQLGKPYKAHCRRRRFAEAVLQLAGDGFYRREIGCFGETLHEVHPLRIFLDIFVRQRGGIVAIRIGGREIDKIEVEFDIDKLGNLFALEHGDGSLEQLAVKGEADGGDMARLLRAKQISGSAQLKIAHGQVEAAAKSAVAFERSKAFAGIGIHRSRLG